MDDIIGVVGELFFASSNDLVQQFDYATRGKRVEIRGLNEASNSS